MRFGVSVPNAGDATQLVNLAVTAEEAGWDGFFLWDHLQLDALRRPPMHDPWVLLGAIAARTSRVRLGTMITPIPRRRPWKLAKEIITLDHLSAGRVIVGVGLGVPAEAEYGAFGEPTGTRLRAAMLDEALPILDSFLCGEPVDHGRTALCRQGSSQSAGVPAASATNLGRRNAAAPQANRTRCTLGWHLPTELARGAVS